MECLVRSLFAGEPMAILPSALDEAMLRVEACGDGPVSLDAARRPMPRFKPRVGRQAGSVAVLPLHGALTKRMNLLTAVLGGTSVDEFGREFDAAVANPDVQSILIDVDSSGGQVAGSQELSYRIRAARGSKPIKAVANGGAFSAAYWVATAADEVIVTPSSKVGSVGVAVQHVDRSQMNEKLGLNVTYIHSGERKIDGNPHSPLSGAARAEMQKHVDQAGAAFISGLAKNRGVSESFVDSMFGGGKVFNAKDAVARNMADRIATFDDVLAEMTSGRRGRARRSVNSVSANRRDWIANERMRLSAKTRRF